MHTCPFCQQSVDVLAHVGKCTGTLEAKETPLLDVKSPLEMMQELMARPDAEILEQLKTEYITFYKRGTGHEPAPEHLDKVLAIAKTNLARLKGSAS